MLYIQNLCVANSTKSKFHCTRASIFIPNVPFFFHLQRVVLFVISKMYFKIAQKREYLMFSRIVLATSSRILNIIPIYSANISRYRQKKTCTHDCVERHKNGISIHNTTEYSMHRNARQIQTLKVVSVVRGQKEPSLALAYTFRNLM